MIPTTLQTISAFLATLFPQLVGPLTLTVLTGFTYTAMEFFKQLFPNASHPLLYLMAFAFSILGVAISLLIGGHLNVGAMLAYGALVFAVSQTVYNGVVHVKDQIANGS